MCPKRQKGQNSQNEELLEVGGEIVGLAKSMFGTGPPGYLIMNLTSRDGIC